MKKYLALALALLMLCMMLPVTAMAADALPAADENGVITLTEDVTLSNTWNISSDVTIDLNGHKLTINHATAIYVMGGSFTVKDSGQNGEMALDGTISLINTTMKLENGTVSFHQRQTGICLMNSDFVMTDGMVYAAVQESFCFNPGYFGTATIDISGGTVKSVSTNTAMIGCGMGSFDLDISISGNTTVDFANELMNGEGDNDVNFEITGGTFTNPEAAKPYLGENKTFDASGKVVDAVTVRVPESGDTTTTTTTGNPSTGAAENTGIAAAMVVMALLGTAAALRK